jgi:hypothetical protein
VCPLRWYSQDVDLDIEEDDDEFDTHELESAGGGDSGVEVRDRCLH